MVNLPFLSKQKKDANKFLTATIDSTDVKVICFYSEGKRLKILGSGKQELENGSVRAGNIIDIENVSEALEIAVTKATKDSEQKIKNIIFGVTGDLCVGLTTTVRLKKPKISKIKQSEAENLTGKINETSYIQVLNEYAQITGESDIDLEIITTSNVYSKLDGKEVASFSGKEGSVLETAVFNAYTPYYHIENLKNITKKAKLNIAAIGSELYSMVEILKYSNEELKDFILINIGQDSTNVAVVFGKGIVATKSMLIGYRHFTEHISNKMGISTIEGAKILKAYNSGSLSQAESGVVEAAIEDIVDIWIEGLRILFNEFSGVKTFASNILLTGTGSDIMDLTNVIINEPWVKSIPFKEPPEYNKVSFMDLGNISDSTGKTNSTEWIDPACLGIIYLEMQEEL